MRALVARPSAPHGIELAEVDAPAPALDEAIVDVRAVSLNRGEARYLPRRQEGTVHGWDVAGVVRRPAADGTGPGEGARVVGLVGEGAWAERAAVRTDRMAELPDGVSFEDASTLPVAGLTAWQMVMNRACVRPGETVLITAAGSGVSTFAIQLCRTLGARVITTASSAEKLEKARALGAEAGIDYTQEDILERVRAFTDGEGVEVVLEHVGTPVWKACFESLKPGGRFVTCGVTAGHRVELHLGRVFSRGLSIMGVGRGTADDMRAFLKVVGQGKVHGIVYRTFPLAEAAAAHAYIESRQAFGRVVMTP